MSNESKEDKHTIFQKMQNSSVRKKNGIMRFRVYVYGRTMSVLEKS